LGKVGLKFTTPIIVGDRVRIKDQADWPSPPGYRLANAEGIVVQPLATEWDEVMEDFQEYVQICLEESAVEEYIGKTTTFRVEDLEKI
jgi:hypothetical protein